MATVRAGRIPQHQARCTHGGLLQRKGERLLATKSALATLSPRAS